MGKLPQVLNTAHDGTVCAVSGSVDGMVEVGLGVLNQHFLAARQLYLNLATLVPAAAWPVDVRQRDMQFSHVPAGPAQRRFQAQLGVGPQS